MPALLALAVALGAATSIAAWQGVLALFPDMLKEVRPSWQVIDLKPLVS